MRTKISWEISNYCTAGCSYCPSHFWSGEKPREVADFLNATDTLINHYKKLGRDIDWTFSGGEPLEMFDFPAVLKACKQGGGNIEITTNGGKLWLDWWAIEPHVDNLHLSYHYWQNPNLIRFIIQAFRGKNKQFEINAPVRHDYFDEDIARILELEQVNEVHVHKRPLYQQADPAIGLMNYTEQQLEVLLGVDWVDQNLRNKPPMNYAERREEVVSISPSFLGRKCNVGIERLRISHNGWVSGSNCNNTHLGNIWDGSLVLPTTPDLCKMQACTSTEDQLITKF